MIQLSIDASLKGTALIGWLPMPLKENCQVRNLSQLDIQNIKPLARSAEPSFDSVPGNSELDLFYHCTISIDD